MLTTGRGLATQRLVVASRWTKVCTRTDNRVIKRALNLPDWKPKRNRGGGGCGRMLRCHGNRLVAATSGGWIDIRRRIGRQMALASLVDFHVQKELELLLIFDILLTERIDGHAPVDRRGEAHSGGRGVSGSDSTAADQSRGEVAQEDSP